MHDLDERAAARPLRARGRASRSSSATSIAGCDGFHGVCRPSIPAGVLRTVRARVPVRLARDPRGRRPVSNDELIYAHHERGFALLSLRSPELSRLYLQCPPDEDIDEWPDDRIWAELQTRLGRRRLDARTRARSSRRASPACAASSPSRCSTAASSSPGDAAHIVPPTGAKGLNLAIARCPSCSPRRSSPGTRAAAARCSTRTRTTCLRRVWRAEHFSWWMTSMLHRAPTATSSTLRLQLSQLRYVRTSQAAATMLAENYVGLEHV